MNEPSLTVAAMIQDGGGLGVTGWQHNRGGVTIDRMNEWYEDGLCFSCNQSGNCCTGPPGAVWFTSHEGEAMAKKLGTDIEKFYQEYAHKLGTKWSLTEFLIEGKYDCVFLDRSTKKPSCKLYEARPLQCRTWPFWPENLENPEAWELAKKHTPCPGMNVGTIVPIEEIRIQRDAEL